MDETLTPQEEDKAKMLFGTMHVSILITCTPHFVKRKSNFSQYIFFRHKKKKTRV